MRKLPARKSIWKAGAAFQVMSLRLAVKVAVLVQHGIGGVLAFADFQHALEHRLALGEVELGLHGTRQRVHLDVGPLLRLLLLAVRPVLADDRADRIGERRLFDQSRIARWPLCSMICGQFSRISIWMLSPTLRHISTRICAVPTWLV